MNAFAARIATLAAAITILCGASAAPAIAAAVGPGQHFFGVVNGNHRNAVVYVVCPGPVRPGGTGPPASGQSLSTILLPRGATGVGFTGTSADLIVARFADDPSVPLRLFTYGVSKVIPTALRLPCGGQGKVSFTPSPASPTAVPDVVTVTYQNLAV